MLLRFTAAAALTIFTANSLEPALRYAAFNQKHPRIQSLDGAAAAPAALTGLRATPSTANCSERFYTQTIDHFSWSAPPSGSYTYQQRYFVNDQFWDKTSGCILFYAGNEAPVDLYVNHTGLFWEAAAAMKALLVFAEHRYFGKSQPFGDGEVYLYALTHEQALADYAALLWDLQANLSVSQPVIVAGGSYGGMLASWMRSKYPATVAGAIAASAPILAFQDNIPAYDSQTYWEVVTRDATAAAGSAPACAANVRAAFSALFATGSTPAGRTNLSRAMSLCSPLSDDPAALNALAILHLNAWDCEAMGSYPYPSDYITGGAAPLPAFPVRASCAFLSDPSLATGDPFALLAAFSAAGGVFNNATKDVACYELPTDIWEDGIWDYLWCSALLPEEMYFSRDGVKDMFFPLTYNITFISEHCNKKFGITPRPAWVPLQYGGTQGQRAYSNIVFSNGEFDPWSSGGVLFNASTSQQSYVIAEGGHHFDLFFSDSRDTDSVRAVRTAEVDAMKRWVSEWYAAAGRSEEL